jgi:DNA topoisomerase-3
MIFIQKYRDSEKLNELCRINATAFGKKKKKIAQGFNDKKVTDHHAIIPTGIQSNLQYNQQQVYDSITSVLLPFL